MTILGQLGNRIQHALRAYTPLDQKAVKVAAQTFRTNPDFDTEEAITTLKTGEALVSFLDEHGAPGVVQRATILPPQSFMGAIDAELRRRVTDSSPVAHKYDTRTDTADPRPQQAAQAGQGVPVLQAAPGQAGQMQAGQTLIPTAQFIPVNGVLRQVCIGSPTLVEYNGSLWPIL